MIEAYRACRIAEAEALAVAAAPQDALMRVAARAIATRVMRLLRDSGSRVPGSTVLVLAGGGHNGGDALYAGADLARRGAAVTALLLSGRAHARALAAARRAGVTVRPALAPDGSGRGEVVQRAARASGVWIDGITGTGASGALREPAAAVVRWLNEERESSADEPIVVAVDAPSGIGTDTGEVDGPVLPAAITLTMGVPTPGLLLPPADEWAGRVEVVDLGLEPALAETAPDVCRLGTADLGDVLRSPRRDDHKYDRGVVTLGVGSQQYPGAALLAVSGALGAGAGMVRMAVPAAVADLVLSSYPEVVTQPGRTDAVVLGSGVDPAETLRARELRALARSAMSERIPLILDAGALAWVPDLMTEAGTSGLGARVVLTPHGGELARLLRALGEDVDSRWCVRYPVRAVRRAQELTGATVLLKGATTLVLGPDTPIYSQADGTAWLATAGSGDVLGGVIGALVASSSREVADDPSRVALVVAAAASLHGRAATRLAGPVRPGDLGDAVRRDLAELISGAHPHQAPGTLGS